MLDSLPDRELICGFLSGKEELLNWEPSDLFQFYYDTKPLKGCLDELLPLLDKAAVERAVKIGACNIYHGCVHNMLYEKNEEILKSLYKSAVFVIQASCFKNTGTYVKKHRDLAEQVGGNAEKIIRISAELKRGNKVNFKEMSEILFQWAKGLINEGTFEQGYEKLEKNIIDVVKEQQSKLGYRKEKIRLYYPRNSLKHFFSNVSEESLGYRKEKIRLYYPRNSLKHFFSNVSEESWMKRLLEEFPAFVRTRLGKIEISSAGGRFCFLIPEEGAEYVHSMIKEKEFIVDLVRTVGRHGCTISEIRELFSRYSDHVHFQEMENDEFDYLLRYGKTV